MFRHPLLAGLFLRLRRLRIPSGSRLILPPADGRGARELRVSRWGSVALGLLAALLLAQLGHHAWLVASSSRNEAELARDREALRRQSAAYAREAERMATQVEGIEVQMRRIAVLAGAEPVQRRLEGIGGAAVAASGFDYANERIDALASRIARLDEQGAALERVVREKSRLIASTPTIWPVRGYLSSGFGRRPDPFTGEIEWHYGIDVSTGVGAPVRVTADGVVLSAGSSATYGKNVVVSHGFGMVTRYAHLSSIEVRNGQRLRRSQVLGTVGNTGRSRAPHLHYEVWVNGRARNPLNHIVDYAPAPLPG